MKNSIVCLLIAAAAFAAPASAQLTRVTGSFAGTLDLTSTHYEGTFSFVFDLAGVPATGAYVIDGGALESFTLTPSAIGATTFTLANTGFYLSFQDGVIQLVSVGGLLSGASGIASITEDFAIYLFPDGAILLFAVADPSYGLFLASDTTGAFTVETVTESCDDDRNHHDGHKERDHHGSHKDRGHHNDRDRHDGKNDRGRHDSHHDRDRRR